MSLTNPALTAKDTGAAYVRALMELLGDREPLDVLGSLVRDLRAATDGLSDEQLRRPEAAGKWSILQVVCHLADTELVVGFRLRQTLSHDRPLLPGIDQDRWAERLRYKEDDFEEVMHRLAAMRSADIRLAISLSADELDRVGLHEERGEETVRHILRMLAGHDLAHLRQVGRIRNEVAGSKREAVGSRQSAVDAVDLGNTDR